MADDNKQTYRFDLDVKDFKEGLKSINEGIENVASSNLGGLISQFDKMLPAIGLVTTAALALKAGIDAIAEGENIKAINQQFNMMADSAGLAGDVIRDKLVAATNGLADDTDVLEGANKVMSKLGVNAAKLPEIMEFSRKATAVYGGDLVSNFENIANAIANGNGRMLKQYGIVIDNEKAYKDYAKSLGVTVSTLSEAQKQQAIMNQALEKGGKAFAGVDENIKANQNALKQLMVIIQQLKEIFVVAFEKTFGPILNKFLQSTIGVFKEIKLQATAFFSDWGENAEAAGAQTEILTRKLTDQKEELRKLKEEGMSWWQTISGQNIDELIKQKEADIIATEGEINGLKKKTQALEEVAAAQEKQNEAAMKSQTGAGGADKDKLASQQAAFEKSLQDMSLARIEMEEKTATDIETVDQLHKEKMEILNLQYEAKLDELRAKRVQGEITADQERAMAKQIEMEKQFSIELEQEKLDEKRLAALDRYAEKNKTTAEGFAGAWKAATSRAIADNANFAKMGTQVFNTVNKNAVAAFKAMGDGSKDAGEAMKGFIFSSLADIATMKGQVMLAEGIGTMNPLQIAQGGALIALGAAISSMAGSAGGGAAAGGGSAGGSFSGGSDMSSMEEKPEVKEPKKAVNLQIMGNLYETEQTRTRLMEMIREVSDATDFNISRIGV